MDAPLGTLISSVVGGLVFALIALVCCSPPYREQNKSLFEDEPAVKGTPNNDSKLA